jgi:hypothetical protein
MALQFKRPVLSAVAFFGTLLALSVGYAAWNSGMAKVNTGDTMYASSWNALVDNINDLDSRWARNGAAIAYTGGNVGIGTASPSAPLEVGNGSNVRGYLKLSNDAVSSPVLQLANGLAGGRTYNLYSGFSANSGTLAFSDLTAGNAVRLAIDPSGNVGIGTASTNHKLRVVGGRLAIDTANLGDGFGTFQQLSGSKTAAGNGVATGVLRCDHTASGRLYVIAVYNINNVASAAFDFTVAYGGGGVVRQSLNPIGSVTNITAAYNNGGAPYQIDVTVTYSSPSAPTIYWAAEGLGASNWYGL